jgi:hypothetical protein
MSIDDWKWLRRKPRFYFVFSLFGLALVAIAVLTRGVVPPGVLELLSFSTAFFGTTVTWAVDRIVRERLARRAGARVRR